MNRVRVVLQAPQFPLNIGAVARVCANFDVKDFVLVSPQCQVDGSDDNNFIARDAYTMAKGPARDYLRNARLAPSLNRALRGCVAAVGFSRHGNGYTSGNVKRRHLSNIRLAGIVDLLNELPGIDAAEDEFVDSLLDGLPRWLPPPVYMCSEEERAQYIADPSDNSRDPHSFSQFYTDPKLTGTSRRFHQPVVDPDSEGAVVEEDPNQSRVALVFGRESVGLLGDELALCTHVCEIPTSQAMPSLNLSHSAAISLAHIFGELDGKATLGSSAEGSVVPEAHQAARREAVFRTWQQVLDKRPDCSLRMMREFRQIIERVEGGLTVKETRVLHALARVCENSTITKS